MVTDSSAEFHREWLQVDMGKPTTVIGIATQGRPPVSTTSDQYLKSFKILYGNFTTALLPINNPTSRNYAVSIQRSSMANHVLGHYSGRISITFPSRNFCVGIHGSGSDEHS